MLQSVVQNDAWLARKRTCWPEKTKLVTNSKLSKLLRHELGSTGSKLESCKLRKEPGSLERIHTDYTRF